MLREQMIIYQNLSIIINFVLTYLPRYIIAFVDLHYPYLETYDLIYLINYVLRKTFNGICTYIFTKQTTVG